MIRRIKVSVRASDGTAWRFPITLWRQQTEVEIEEGSVILLGGATPKWDNFNRRGTFNLGEGGVVIPHFDTAQAREMKEWFVTWNELAVRRGAAGWGGAGLNGASWARGFVVCVVCVR